MTDNLGFGRDKRRQGNLDVLEGKATFRYVKIIDLGLNVVRVADKGFYD